MIFIASKILNLAVLRPFKLGLLVAFYLLFSISALFAQTAKQAVISAQNIDNYARIIVDFVNEYDLPTYFMSTDNNILIIEFEEPFNFTMPEMAQTLPKYIIASRIDPDRKGVRFALKQDFRINKTEAGEKLFIDILPSNWQGAVPGLPAEVVEELASRSKEAMILAEQRQKEEFIREYKPSAKVRVGRHPTFIRLLIDWDIEVKSDFSLKGQTGELKFDWPVPIDLYALEIDLPTEIISINNEVSIDGSVIKFEVAKGVIPRFFVNSAKQYIIDIDLLEPEATQVDIASLLPDAEQVITNPQANVITQNDGSVKVDIVESKGKIIEPTIEKTGSTIKLTFPFERETAAAVFRRGETLWILFETFASIKEPKDLQEFSLLSDNYSVINASGTSIIRIKLPIDRLATLGSQGRSWVLSLGDLVLAPGELVTLSKKQTGQGLFEVVADAKRVAGVHQLRDPDVGDVIEVVTTFPPTIGVARQQSFVEFNVLKSVHGLAIQPLHENIEVRLEDQKAIISTKRGLIVSTSLFARTNSDEELENANRAGYVNLTSLIEEDITRFRARKNDLANMAAQAEQGERAQMLLNLAQFYLANEFYYETIGILDVASSNLASNRISKSMQLTKAAALTMADRSEKALEILNDDEVGIEIDAMIWRTIAKQQTGDFAGSRSDALSAETIILDYPLWVQTQFFLSATKANIEYGDISLAIRYLTQIKTSILNEEDFGKYIILSGRIDEGQERYDEALDTYGQVLVADNRPNRAEAVYRTLLLLKKMQRLNSVQAAETLALEVMIWRGSKIEAKMLKLLAELYFDIGSYREAFDTVKEFARSNNESENGDELIDLAHKEFTELFLDGKAETLEPIKALSLFYDYRYLAPAGAKGDQMIRNLAKRLVKVDLLEQAEQLLQYQIEERLEGIAKAQIAADLAVIYLADRAPEKAIKLLNSTRLAGIPASLERQRRVLEGRALIDAGRQDLALDILSKVNGKDADLLKIDAHWKAKRYANASEIIENLYAWELERGELSKTARDNIIKASVGYVLSDDIVGLSRLRLKYGELMSNTPEWPMFKFVTDNVDITSLEFKKLSREIADIDSLNAFLKSYKDNYGGDGALTPKGS